MKIVEETSSLRDVLESLVNIADKAESEDGEQESQLPTLQLLLQPHGPLLKCQSELENLEQRLRPVEGFHGMKKALAWPLKQDEVKNTLLNIRRLKETLTLALTADQT